MLSLLFITLSAFSSVWSVNAKTFKNSSVVGDYRHHDPFTKAPIAKSHVKLPPMATQAVNIDWISPIYPFIFGEPTRKRKSAIEILRY